MILETLRTTFDACKALPEVSRASRFFSISQAGYESPQDNLDMEVTKRRELIRHYKQNRDFKGYVDPDYRRKFQRTINAANRRYTQNPEHREKVLEKMRIKSVQYRAENPQYLIKKALRQWLRDHAWVRDELDWRSHIPVWSDVKIARTCESCSIEQYNGFRLWWRRKYDPSLFDCTSCFLGSDPRKAFPKGYEDVKTLKQLRMRKQELDRGMKPGSLSKTKSSDVQDVQSRRPQ